jgi:putative transposase
MQISRSGFYKWLRRQGLVTERMIENEVLKMEIKKIFSDHKKRYGAVKIKKELDKQGTNVSIKKVNKIMKNNNLVCLHTKKFKVATTQSNHALPVADNQLNRNFTATAPNQVWVADITYIKTLSGWLYLAIVLDLFSRRIVGYATSVRIDNNLVISALDKALGRYKISQGLIFHSDRGVQYASHDFRSAIKEHDFVQSMSRKGDCWDNAPAESFFATLKKELIYPLGVCTRFQVERELFEYIEAYYNTVRSHSSLNYKSPLEFEKMYRAA